MNTNTFKASIDWSHELLNSVRWVLETFATTVPCLLLVLVVVGRMTRWGRQFRRISGDYFNSRHGLPAWALIAVLLLSTIVSVRLTVLLSYYGNDVFTSLQVAFQGAAAGQDNIKHSGIGGFWMAMLIFAVLATVHVIRYLLDLFLMQRFIMRWRIWLSRRFIDDWLDDSAFFRRQFLRDPIDNPDQRIQQDIDVFTTGVGADVNNPAYGSSQTLLFGAVEAAVSVFAFGAILWNLSGSLTLSGVTIPKALFWIVIVYVGAATLVAFIVGRPLIRLTYFNELRNAALRYALVRVRDSSAAISLYQGETLEGRWLKTRLSSVMSNYRSWLHRTVYFTGWNLTVSQAINPLPYIVQAPRLFAGQISLGGVVQSVTAFGEIQNSLSFFRNAYDQFASYRAAVIRLDGLLHENLHARAFTRIESTRSEHARLEVDDVEVRTPDGQRLVDALSFSLDAGDTLLIRGPSGIGKTILLKSLAGLWPFASGRVHLPSTRDDAMFVPQLPYLPAGDLRAIVSYPHEPGTVADREIQQALIAVALSHLAIRLNDSLDWPKVLSVGEQQRVAFARILLSKPSALFLDEATSAMDKGLELLLYELIRSELPQTILINVSHRDTVERFHRRHLELAGGGEWRLDPSTCGAETL
jgi:vitamin B12/bleomycin/antimicrobial peptide transport system ATP-binding/permease protein